VPALPFFLLADGSGPAAQPTAVRLAWDEAALHVRFECADRDAWGTFTRRDDPLYQEEAVEVFLAPGAADPARYFEFEVSPRGTLFDAVVDNPDANRATMRTDPAWDCPGLGWAAGPGAAEEDWWATLAIPWRALLATPEAPLPLFWRANFYRIERPRDGAPEFSAWSPTLTAPADFHKPARFGRLSLGQ
jgi:cellulose/xylan binding protein with CBM9 domain